MKNYSLELNRNQIASVIFALDKLISEIEGREGFEVSEANCQDAVARARLLLKIAEADAAREGAAAQYSALVNNGPEYVADHFVGEVF